ncbi:hypothetical protein OH76DRAFT_553721 [Lentinus brumalis]|uniref:Uncharacterized protein n=1 Tax=Lentinus brumalis TaxID=2498619 RepID=A0A371D960_9APHY|nr:hypothetical protein OH76DRAFT_553721 [Polyporus brumalis]
MGTTLGQSGISVLYVMSTSAFTHDRLPARSACLRRNIASPVALPRFRFLTRSSGESPRLSYIPQNDTQHIDLSSSTLVPLSPNIVASSPALPHPLPFPSRTPPSVLRLECVAHDIPFDFCNKVPRGARNGEQLNRGLECGCSPFWIGMIDLYGHERPG